MPLRGYLHLVSRWLIVLGLTISSSCATRTGDQRVASDPVSRASAVSSTRLARDKKTESKDLPSPVPARPVGPATTQPAVTIEDIQAQIPDPVDELERVTGELAKPDLSRQQKAKHERVIRRIKLILRPRTVRLSLTDAIRRALIHNYRIQVQTYNPAIEATRIVEAEAQFDAVFFTNFSNNKQDRPSPSQLSPNSLLQRGFESGVRKLLSTGTQAQISYKLNRTETDLLFATLNPSYFNQFIVDLRQPFLRGFGLDFNRFQIEISKLDRQISIERMRKEFRETLFNVEQAYWQLLRTRRGITISARLLANLKTILHSLEQRAKIGYDVYAVQLNLTKSRIEQQEAEFIRLLNEVENAEDFLKSLINDPDLNLSQETEIIPTNEPSIEPVVIDQLGEVTAGLSHRSELHEARLAIKQAQLSIGVAKNQALPRLDVLLRYIIDGLGTNADRAFSQLSENNFNEYVIGVEFEWPIGNRGPEAALRRARLQQAQAIKGHQAQIESVIREIQQAVRDLHSNYDQIGPQLRAAQAAQDQLRATVARMERRDPPSLQVELDAHQALATTREQLLQVLTDYNIALSNLERQKGTLLKYNNIVIRGVDDESYLKPYSPVRP